MDNDDEVTMRRRTPEEQAEYLLFQVGVLTARVNDLVRTADEYGEVLSALLLGMKSLENRTESLEARLSAVERATPLRRPKAQRWQKP
jgi:hypothetical protein